MEVRASDLRFTAAELAAYLNDINGLGLNAADVAVLDSSTEGWAAAIQLAALSLRGRSDPTRFIADFAGDDRFVLDYLADEVLGRVPSETREFLLRTSILDRLTGPLCDAVTGATVGKTMLERLERQNLFLIPLDDQRRWYRYHHLFADVLKAHLLDEAPRELPGLHRRACDWLADNGDPDAAVRHALAAGDADRAADLVELAVPELRRLRNEAQIRRWAGGLPSDIVRNRPVLALGIVGALMASNEFAGVEPRLAQIESQLEHPDDLVVVDRNELERLPAAIETYRAALALTTGDLAATTTHARAALDRAATDDLLSIAAASALIGLAAWPQGNLNAAYDAYAVSADHLGRADHVADVLGCTIALADIAITQGRLRDAAASIRTALAAAERACSREPLRGTADMHVAMSLLDLERNDLSSAAEHLRSADELGDEASLPQNAYRWRVALARLRAAQGEAASAVELLTEAERVYVGDFSPNVQPVAATRARALAAAGRLEEALGWAANSGLTTTDPVSYAMEYGHVTLVRVQLAVATTHPGSALDEAADLLGRLVPAAEAGGRRGSLIELLVLQALALHDVGQQPAAMTSLERAVRLAEPEGYCRTFIGEGPPIAPLLDALGELHPDWLYLQRLRDATRRDGSPTHACDQISSVAPGRPAGPLDPLSARELDILRYLRSELDGPAIARELSVSLSTVRTHTQHVYAKLGVNNRRAAVRRAHQLGLFTHRVVS